jgi:hypothetical protein
LILVDLAGIKIATQREDTILSRTPVAELAGFRVEHERAFIAGAWHRHKALAVVTAASQATNHNRERKFSHALRIPVKWATDSGDVGQGRSEATLVVFLH